MSKFQYESIHKVKIVIWDLDETFWYGTVDNGDEISIPDNHITLVKKLTDKGIINSICSKNEKENILKILNEKDLLKYFVCPSIDWTGKGNRIANLLLQLGLRAENALFIDDNHLNRQEAEFVLPELLVASPEIIPTLLDSLDKINLKDDLSHKRLNQYKIIEKKLKAEESFVSNKDFLKSCNIRVEINNDCIKDLDRISELVLRSNQLNFTKIRSTRDEIEKLICDESVDCGTVYVNDRFGDYGMVGFYAIKNNKAIHFLFSCRTIGMGIEQFVFQTLGCPSIEIKGDVISALGSCESLEWINCNQNSDDDKVSAQIEIGKKIMLKGPCDMEQIFNFMKKNDMIDSEFTHVNLDTGVDIQSINHLSHIVQSCELSHSQKQVVIDELPFSSDDFYSTRMFNGEYDTVFLSTAHDAHFGVYKRKVGGQKVAFGEAKFDMTNAENFEKYISGNVYNANCTITRDFLEFFSKEYEFMGITSEDDFRQNIIKVLQYLPLQTKLVLILPSEIPFINNSNPAFDDVHIIHQRNNNIVRELAKEYKQLSYIHIGDYIHSQNDYYNNIYHYTASVYYNVTNNICQMASQSGMDSFEISSKNKILFARFKQVVRGFSLVDKIIFLSKKIPIIYKLRNKWRSRS